MEPIAGYNKDGTPYYGPDILGMYIGKEDTGTSNVFGPGPTSSNLAAAGIPSTMSNGAGADSAGSTSGNFWGTIGGLTDFLFSTDLSPSAASADIAKGAAGNSTTGGVLSAASGAISFIFDIPRVLTTLIGLILIIAGIFALARGPAVQVLGSAVREAATS